MWSWDSKFTCMMSKRMNSDSYDSQGLKSYRLDKKYYWSDMRCYCMQHIRYDRPFRCIYRSWVLSMSMLSIFALEAIDLAGIDIHYFLVLLRNIERYRREDILLDRSIFGSRLHYKQEYQRVAYFDYGMFQAQEGRLVVMKWPSFVSPWEDGCWYLIYKLDYLPSNYWFILHSLKGLIRGMFVWCYLW